jgi:mRNA-degrading endonuclease RelE of RelBE toxin-antitoxin system
MLFSASPNPGGLKSLQDLEEVRLRVGAYRLFFVHAAEDTIEVRRVRHRFEAYR